MAAKVYYVYLAVLLVVGIQVATSKSLDELSKDDRYNARVLRLNKRAANGESKELADAPHAASPSSGGAEKEPTPIWVITTPKSAKRRRQSVKASTSTTPATTTEAHEDEPTESQEAAEEPEKDEKKEEEEEKEEVATVKPLGGGGNRPKPKSQKKPRPTTPSSVAPQLLDRANADDDATSPSTPKQRPAIANLLPPMPYYPPGYASFPAPALSTWGFGVGPVPYNYPSPSGPAFGDAKPAGPGFASASASAGGSAGTITATSTFPGGAGQGASSFSSSFPTGGGQPAGFIRTRGSFRAGDDDSVAIEVNGPAPSSGIPQYSSQPGYAASGPGYSASASYGAAGPFWNPFAFGSPANQQDLFQQYFAALQAQHQAFQQQLQAQILAQQQANGALASSAASITNDDEAVDPNAKIYARTRTRPNSASSIKAVESRLGQAMSSNRIRDQNNRVDSNLASTGDASGEPATAFSGISLGPTGGLQAAQISPAAPEIFSHFGESIAPPSGNVYGVFSSSSSSSQTGPDGKTVSHKSSTVGVNDNGKITFKTVHDP